MSIPPQTETRPGPQRKRARRAQEPRLEAVPEEGAGAASGFERVPPQDLDAEQSVLGGMLLSKDAIADVVTVLKGDDFYRPAHETIFNVILDLYGKGEPADPITLAAELTRRGEITRVGGSSYLHTLVNVVPTAANAEYYAEIVFERAVLRRLVEAGTRITQMGYAADGALEDIVNDAQKLLFSVNEQRTTEDYERLGVRLESDIDAIEQLGRRGTTLTGLPTGFADLDSLTNGYQPEQMIVVAARPAMGKSTFATDILNACSVKADIPTAFFSLEMSRSEISHRIMSSNGKIPLHHIRSGQMTEDDWGKLRGIQQRLFECPMYLDTSPNLTLMDIRAKTRRMVQQHGIQLLVVDYLQLMSTGGRRRDARHEEVGEISRSLKLLAKELHIPVVALSQLNRNSEQRTDKKPVMSDLRESGSIEQDADMVILLHRDDAYDKESPRAGEADFIVAKHRNGPTGTLTTAFQGHYSRFVDMAAND